jgi:hypothetical protein
VTYVGVSLFVAAFVTIGVLVATTYAMQTGKLIAFIPPVHIE